MVRQLLMSTFSSRPSLTLPAGMRATRAVQALLFVLPNQQPEGGWTESTVEAALQQQGVQVNRVTVYRALDRLTHAGLLLRTVDSQRITRYAVVDAASAAPSAHWECTDCHQAVPLGADAVALQTALKALHQAVAQTTGIANPVLDIAVQTQCAQCATAAR